MSGSNGEGSLGEDESVPPTPNEMEEFKGPFPPPPNAKTKSPDANDLKSSLEDLTEEIMTLDESLKQSTSANQETHNLMVEMMNNMVGIISETQELNTHLQKIVHFFEARSLADFVTPQRRTAAFSSPQRLQPQANTKASPKTRSRSRSRSKSN